MTKRCMTADEAAETLGISKATLYAYVSRGLIRSQESGLSSRGRHYLAEDVYKLREHIEYRRNPVQVVLDALTSGRRRCVGCPARLASA
jgi:citrate synthase